MIKLAGGPSMREKRARGIKDIEGQKDCDKATENSANVLGFEGYIPRLVNRREASCDHYVFISSRAQERNVHEGHLL